MTLSLFNHHTGNYRVATTKEIREIYFDGMSRPTFKSQFSPVHIEEMEKLGFKSFKGYQNPKIVQYMVEIVGRISENKRK